MTHLYFHCGHSGELLLDYRGADVTDLKEARDRALAVARSVMETAYGHQDFSDWFVCVGDEDDEELMRVPFTSALPTLH
ncbi:DUF6894 family protein [Methylobacterium nodulans]|uniref:DUF6894 domain-containing protein n=1 Tax=Methylobacterium nodulans (strain LMG 21967 / CNCM I-2342 / ORS 2060) TaxID=460265 RepID=B8IUG5_METNO|nr:hypothetical protein [Methylobacterium nodulans]ACL55210.1 conserved hypothetical protein [Methylobacterium nodulans ORS 2060]